MVYLRQLNLDWWIRSWDVVYHESKSFSIAKFGSRENISLVGYPMNYHWFGNAWIGMNSDINRLPPWLSIAQVTPAFSALLIASVVKTLSKRASHLIAPALAALAVYIFASGGLSTANPPNVVAIMWSFAALFVAFEFCQNNRTLLFLLFTLLGFATFSAKVSAGFMVIASFVILDFWHSIRIRHQILAFFVRTTCLLAISIFSFFYIIGGPSRLGNNTFKPSLKGSGYAFGVELERSVLIFAIGTLGSLFMVFLTALPIILLLKLQNASVDFYLLSLLILFTGLLPFLFLIDDGMIYFQSNALNLVSVASGVSLVMLLDSLKRSNQLSNRRMFFLAIVGGLAGVAYRIATEFNWRETVSSPGGPTPVLVSIQAIFIALCFGLAFLTVKPVDSSHWYNRNFNRLVTFSFVAIAGIVVPEALKTLNQFSQKIQVENTTNFYIGSTDLIEASSWLKQNSNLDDVLATNKFCIPTGVENCIDPKFFGVSSTANRKLLVEGPYYIVGGPYFSDLPDVTDESKYPLWVQERLNLSRGFADGPTAEIAARLRELGVDWFYLFLDNTENRNWAPYATVEYQNSEVAILRLVDPNL
jgi:hypothetical protein